MAMTPEWPATRWGLSAPESYVLLHGSGDSGVEAFKLALEELVARKYLALVQVKQRGFLGRTSTTPVLTSGERAADPSTLSGPLARLLDFFQIGIPMQTFRDGTIGVRVADFARHAGKWFGALTGYARRDILPSLVERGLYAVEQDRLFGIIPRSRHVLTAQGQQARGDLEEWLRIGRERFPQWSKSDPSQALAYFGMAGASILLMTFLFPDLRLLQERMADSATVTSDATPELGQYRTGDESGNIAAEEALSGLDVPGQAFDLSSLTFDFDLGTFDSLDSAFEAIDAGVDSGGGDGGDGDGGDGGC
jgi:hypothetical protein